MPVPKIDIPKEKLVELYIEQKLTTREIAKIFSVHGTLISSRLREFNIPTTKAKRQFLSKKLEKLSNLQKEFLIGTLLGDGCLNIPNKGMKKCRFQVNHCTKQKDYIDWKFDIMKNIASEMNTYEHDNSAGYVFKTVVHDDFDFYRKLFYPNGKKIIVPELKDHITPLGVAVWYMDDGNLTKKTSRIYTCGFSKSENEILSDIMFDKFGIKCRVAERKGKYGTLYYLAINVKNTVILHQLIKDYVLECMRYKLVPNCSSTTECQNQ